MNELLTIEEAATYLRVSRATLWRWCKEKRVPAVKIGRGWRIPRRDLEALLQGLSAASTESSRSPNIEI